MDNERERVKEKEPAVTRCLIKTLSILIYSGQRTVRLDHYSYYRLENIIDIARIIIDVKNIYSYLTCLSYHIRECHYLFITLT